jgi:hypothetical protein
MNQMKTKVISLFIHTKNAFSYKNFDKILISKIVYHKLVF